MAEHKKSILITEDELSLLDLFSGLLKKNGFIVYEAKNGKDGLDLALSKKPDLIILDILMPEVNGLEMLKQLRQDEWGKSAQVLLLTNYEDQKTWDQAKALGVIDCWLKVDASPHELVDKIKNILT